jgi:hypothetical protein
MAQSWCKHNATSVDIEKLDEIEFRAVGGENLYLRIFGVHERMET